MKPIIRLLAVLAVLSAAAFLYLQPKHATLVFYASKPEAVILQKPDLSDKALRALTVDFVKESYFAAFAVRPDGRYYWVGGRHSAANARTDALAGCNAGGAAQCSVIVELRPTGYQSDLEGVSVSGKATQNGIVGLLPENGEILFALAKDGSWAVQKAQDGWLFPQWSVWARCRDHAQTSARPTSLGANTCVLYKGPAYGVPQDAS